MSDTKHLLIKTRLSRSEESLKMAEFAVKNQFWNSAGSELYYTCFYLVSALFARFDLVAHTHAGLSSLFALHFIKENKVDRKWGKLLATLYDTRQDSDYGDLIELTEEEILPLVKEVEEFSEVLLKLIRE